MSKKSKHRAGNEDRPLTAAELNAMGPWMHGIEDLPVVAQKAVRRAAGRPRKEHPKEKVTVRFDYEIIAALRAKGRGWQTELNALVRSAIEERRI